MKSLLNISIITFSVLLFSCNEKNNGGEKKQSEKNGGAFSIAENTEIRSVFPLLITAQTEALITSQMHECLVRLNPHTLDAIPGIAEKWEVSADGKTITFHLNKNARFHDDKCFPDGKGPVITSNDVKFSLELLSTKSDFNFQFETVLKDKLLGANDFYDKKANSLAGVKVIDESTIQLLLEQPSLSFIQLLAHPAASIISEVAYKAYGTNLKVGAGPFIYDPSSNASQCVLVKNKNYYRTDSAGCSLPYLDTVIINLFSSIEEGLTSFENGKTDLVNTLPSLRVKDMLEKNINEFQSNPPKSILHHEPEMISQYYTFNTKKAPFNNVKVRQAVNYAIDRDRIINNILQGQAIASAINGITPNTFSGYDIKSIVGYSLNIAKAKQLLAEAGYPYGKGFPETTVIVNSGNSRNSSVAVEIQKQLKENLNININFESLPNKQKTDLQMIGKGSIYRDAWVADYPSPETYLTLFYGSGVPSVDTIYSYPNTSRYQNKDYDTYFTKGKFANNKDTSYYYFMKAEQQLMNDAVIIPLWYEGSYRLLTSKIKGFHLNAMRYYDLTKAYKVK